MHIDIDAFADELTKIAEVDEVTRERLIRGLKGGLVAAGGFGLGYGLGNLAVNAGMPAKVGPIKSPLLAGGIGMGASALSALAMDNLKKKYLAYVRAGGETNHE